MKDISKINYDLKQDISFYLNSNAMYIDEFIDLVEVSKEPIYNIMNDKPFSNSLYEKIYSFIYKENFYLNDIKADVYGYYKDNKILFHGSKKGIRKISIADSRANCDFGKGFYLSETYPQAASFVFDFDCSSVYSFECDLKDLNVYKISASLEWMIAICYYRGNIDKYKEQQIVKETINKIEQADVVIAPIADNKMFHIMKLFVDGDINVDVAINALASSSLGLQYVIKSEKALRKLKIIEKLYLSKPEREEYSKKSFERQKHVDEILKDAQRKYRNGLFIEEVFNERI